MKNTTKILILAWLGLALIMLGLLIKRTTIIENKVDDLKILNELREPVKLPMRAVEVTPEMYAIVDCESEWKHEGIYGDEGKAYGYAQFHKPTFEWLKELSNKPDLDYYDARDQIELLGWAMENGRAYLWSCARSLGLTNQ